MIPLKHSAEEAAKMDGKRADAMTEPERNPLLDAVAASDLVSASVLASLIGALASKGVLSDEDVKEVYERAFLLLETSQGTEPAMRPVYEAAREIIESLLR